jgi:hypothetical protein
MPQLPAPHCADTSTGMASKATNATAINRLFILLPFDEFPALGTHTIELHFVDSPEFSDHPGSAQVAPVG